MILSTQGRQLETDPARAPSSAEIQGAAVPRASAWKKTLLLGLLLAAGGSLVIIAIAMLAGGLGGGDQTLVYYVVRRGDLPIIVTERGNLESQDNIKVDCDVDDVDGDGIHGTPILWIVPNGASVKEGELVVELDAAPHQERLDRQILDTERARAEQIQSNIKYENQQTQNETALAEAQLKVELAKLALRQFEDEEGGTFQIDLQDVELQIQEAEAQQLIQQTNLEGVEQLYKLGYRSSGELAQARLSALKAERQLATAVSRKRELVEYRYLKTKMELEGALASAERALAQVERDNEALLAQARASMEAADEAFKKEQDRLERYREQLKNCRIYAPASGMVAYATARHRWHEEIRAGAAVRLRQTILTLPNLKKMQVRTSVHESVLDEIRADLPVTVRVDAFKDRSYEGSVRSVAVLPDQGGWMASDTKVYETIVSIDEDVDQLKPGMTAVVEIKVDRLTDVLSVPVQAIVQIEDDSWCYVDAGGTVQRRMVELGRTNEKFVEIRAGLSEGERVVLNTTAIFDEAKESETRRKSISPDGSRDDGDDGDGGDGGREPTQEDTREALTREDTAKSGESPIEKGASSVELPKARSPRAGAQPQGSVRRAIPSG